MRYSICMTNYNTEDVLPQCLESIISKISPEEFEIVVVDNCSTDNSPDILERYAKRFGNMKIIVKRCLRGRGRQIAFENSTGEIIITADCDTIYSDLWIKVIHHYGKNRYDFGLSMWFSQIYPRELLERVGGWQNLQYLEDAELWSRMAEIGKYHTYPIVSGENIKRDPTVNILDHSYKLYRRIHDKMVLFSHIPLKLFIGGYYHTIAKSFTGRPLLKRVVYYSTLVLCAKVISVLRRMIFEYGNIKHLRDPNIFIDLKLTDANNLMVEEKAYDTLEECLEAYRKKDFRFLPGFYD